MTMDGEAVVHEQLRLEHAAVGAVGAAAVEAQENALRPGADLLEALDLEDDGLRGLVLVGV
jgi:hypothetical protein